MKKLLFLGWLTISAFTLYSQSISPNKSIYVQGENMVFTYTGASGTTDWIGVYKQGETPGTPASQTWDYVTPPSGNLALSTTGLASGMYEAHLLCCDGYSIKASTIAFEIKALTIKSRMIVYRSGDSLVFKVANTFENSSIQIFKASDFTAGVLNVGAVPVLQKQVGAGTAAVTSKRIAFNPFSSIDLYMALLISNTGAEEGRFSFEIKAKPVVPTILTKLAFGSCSYQGYAQPTLLTAITKNPDLFIYLGDNIYTDSYIPADVQNSWENMIWMQPEYHHIRAATNLLATWDDHDYGYNDEDKDYSLKTMSQTAFLNWMEEPAASPRRSQPGIYTSYMYGPTGNKVQIIMLDTRYFLDNRKANTAGCGKHSYCPWNSTNDFNKTILGNDQWLWLDNELKKPADLRIIASSIPYGVEYNGFETWANFPFQQQRIMAMIKKHQANNVVMLSGDVHYTEISAYRANGVYPIYDITASAINNTYSPAETNSNRVNNYLNVNPNFSTMDIDWINKNFTLKSIGATDNLMFSHTIEFDSTNFLTDKTPVLNASKLNYAVGETTNFSYSNSTGNTYDKFHIYTLNNWTSRDQYGNFGSAPIYTHSSNINTMSGSITGPNNLPAGTYVAGLFCCGGSYDLDSVQFTVGLSTVVEEQNTNTGFKIFPNPNKGLFTFELIKNSPGTIFIIDAVGREVYRCAVNTLKQDVDLSRLSKGIYLVKYSSAEETFSRNLIIE
ncbi:MAG: alkaline phosphatase D family protein [Bacteroidota bacterium]